MVLFLKAYIIIWLFFTDAGITQWDPPAPEDVCVKQNCSDPGAPDPHPPLEPLGGDLRRVLSKGPEGGCQKRGRSAYNVCMYICIYIICMYVCMYVYIYI